MLRAFGTPRAVPNLGPRSTRNRFAIAVLGGVCAREHVDPGATGKNEDLFLTHALCS